MCEIDKYRISWNSKTFNSKVQLKDLIGFKGVKRVNMQGIRY